MKYSTIKNNKRWYEYYGISGNTAQSWLMQVFSSERITKRCPHEVMKNLRIGGFDHAHQFQKAGIHNPKNTKMAFEVLSEEVERLAKELDDRLHQLTAVEQRYRLEIIDLEVQAREDRD